MTLPLRRGTHAARLVRPHKVGVRYQETDTGLIYYDNGTTWATEKASGLVLKTADETVNNSAALQDDDHLKFPIEASERWGFQMFLEWSCASNVSDLKVGWTVPAGASLKWTNMGSAAGAATAANPVAIGTSSLALGSGTGEFLNVLVGMILAGGTAGTAQFQWAQNTATVEDTKLLTGTYMKLERLA